LAIDGKSYELQCVPGKWSEAQNFIWPGNALESSREEPVSTTGAWNENVFTAKIVFTQTPYVLTLKCDFSKDKVAVDPEFNVSFGPIRRPQLVGALN